MRSTLSPIRSLLLASALVLAPSCGDKPLSAGQKRPPVADLTPADEPQLDQAAVAADSAKALDDYDTAHGAWGQGEHFKVARLCWWYRDIGFTDLKCGPRP
jgi:hypothetical protein